MYDPADKPVSTDIYFAAKPAKDTASILLQRAMSFYNLLSSNAYLEKLQAMWRMYHGAYQTDMGVGHRIQFTGEQGELVHMPVNHFRNLAQHIFVMITANRPTMDPKAVNTDYKSLAQTYLAKGILEYYMREKHLEDNLKKAVEMSIVLGSGFIKLDWNATGGNSFDADPDTGEIDYEGELEFSNLSPFDVVMDGTKETWSNDWLLCRTFQNRFNLIAKYPELEQQIRAIPPKSQSSVYRLAAFTNDDTDDVCVYEFYHKRNEAMPDGRYLLFLDTDCILLDTKMPYRVIPIFRIVPSEIMGTPYGYTPMFDIYPIQEMMNATYSAIATNQNAFAVQNIFVPRGADIVFNNLDGAMNIIEANAKPEALNLTQTPAEVFQYLNVLVQAAETLSGVNSVARGNPEASLKSGTALALVQSMALQFTSGLQQSYVKLIEDVGTSLLHILKDFATTPKFIALVGKNNRPFIKEFTGESISAINRVTVDVGNPLAQTIAGRVQMAEQLLQMNLIKTPQQYFMVMETGRLDSMFEGQMDDLLCIKAENEKLMEGQKVRATMLDAHKTHIIEHRAVLSDPDFRNQDDNDELINNTLDHIQQHIDYLRTTDPGLLGLIGETPLPALQPGQPGGPPAAPGMPPGAPGGQPPAQMQQPPKAPAHGKSSAPKVMAPQAGLAMPGTPIQGPGQTTGVNVPAPARVNASLLPNPSLQQNTMGNVNSKK
jgi:hypothetical protein